MCNSVQKSPVISPETHVKLDQFLGRSSQCPMICLLFVPLCDLSQVKGSQRLVYPEPMNLLQAQFPFKYYKRVLEYVHMVLHFLYLQKIFNHSGLEQPQAFLASRQRESKVGKIRMWFASLLYLVKLLLDSVVQKWHPSTLLTPTAPT